MHTVQMRSVSHGTSDHYASSTNFIFSSRHESTSMHRSIVHHTTHNQGSTRKIKKKFFSRCILYKCTQRSDRRLALAIITIKRRVKIKRYFFLESSQHYAEIDSSVNITQFEIDDKKLNKIIFFSTY